MAPPPSVEPYDAAFEAIVSRERARLAPLYADLFRQRAPAVEDRARAVALAASGLEQLEAEAQSVGNLAEDVDPNCGARRGLGLATSSSAMVLVAEGAVSPPDPSLLAAAAAQERQMIASLEGELLQEQVFAEELQTSELAQREQERQLREQIAAAGRCGSSDAGGASAQGGGPRRPASPHHGCQGPAVPTGLFAEIEQERARASQLEQKAWRCQNAAGASQAHQELLLEHHDGLRKRLADIELQSREHSMELLYGERELSDARLSEELETSEGVEAALRRELQQHQSAECAAQLAVDGLHCQVLDLNGDCGALLLDSAADEDRDAVERDRVLAVLRASLPPYYAAAGGTLDALVSHLEHERPEVYEVARTMESQTGDTPSADERLLQRLRADVDGLHQEVAGLAEEASHEYQAAEEAEAEAQKVARATRDDLEDSELELSELRYEADLLRRHQTEWQRTQIRTLRLVEDLQRERVKGIQAQALVATRLGELRKEALLAGDTFDRTSSPPSGSVSPPQGNRRLEWLTPGGT